MKKETVAFTLLIIGCLLLSFIHCPLFDIFFDDKEIFRYTGMVINKNGVPYRDFFDHKPPLIYFLNAAGLLIGRWGLWIIDTLLVLSATLFFYSICRQKLTYPWLLPLLFILMLRSPVPSFGIGMTREYTTIFILLFFCAMNGNYKYRYFFLGLLSALIFFMQQDQVVPLIPLLLYVLFYDNKFISAAVLKRFSGICLGFVSITIPLLLYFILNHSFQYFWEDAFLFNFNWYTENVSWTAKIKAIINTLHTTGYDVGFYLVILLAIFSLIYGNNKPKMLITAIFCVLFSFSAELVSGKLATGLGVTYYLLPLSATLPILLYVVFAYDKRMFVDNKIHQLIYVFIISILLLVNIIRYSTNLPSPEKSWPKTSPEFSFFKNVPLQNFQLYVFNNANMVALYNEHTILSPSKWIYHFFWGWYINWDADDKILNSIIMDLQKHNTKYILDYSDRPPIHKHSYKYWKSFLQENYNRVLIEVPQGYLWQKKDAMK